MRAIALPVLAVASLLFVLTAMSSDAFVPEDSAHAEVRPERSALGPAADKRGLAGDGKADETEALRRWIASRPGTITLPTGVYRITETLVVPLDEVGWTSISGNGTARIVMEGAGPALRFVGTHQGTADPGTVRENVWQRQRMPLIDGVEIVGAHAEADGIELVGTMQAILSRVNIRHVRDAVRLTGRNRNVILSECHLYDNHGVGVLMDRLNLHQVNIANCHISYNDAGGIVLRRSEVRNLHIACCDIEGNMPENGQGPATANILLDTREGSVREGAIVGCTIQHTHKAVGSANIRLLGTSAELPQKVGNWTIGDNVLSDVAVNIHLKHARGVTIVGNTMWKAFEHNLLVEGSSQIVVGANLCDRNPDYRPADSPNTILFEDCRDCTISGLHLTHTLSESAGLTLRRCRWFNITGCSVLDCAGGGIEFEDVFDSRLSDCVIRCKETISPALRIEGGRGNVVSDNVLTGGWRGEQGTALLKDNVTP